MTLSEDYSFEKITQMKQKERRKTLSKLPKEFYERFAERIEQLKELFQEENKKDPTSLRSMMYADEIRKTKLILDEILRRRKRKIILAALRSAEVNTEPPADLLPLEHELFDKLVADLKSNQRSIEGILGDEVYDDDKELAPDRVEIKTEDMIVMESLPEMDEAQQQDAAAEDQTEAELAMVRVLGDIGSFMSPDKRSYNLRKEDILEVPMAIAKILINHKKAELYSA